MSYCEIVLVENVKTQSERCFRFDTLFDLAYSPNQWSIQGEAGGNCLPPNVCGAPLNGAPLL